MERRWGAGVFIKDSDGAYRSTLFSELAWAEHGFGTRRCPDGLGGPRIATLRQVHSDVALWVTDVSGCAGEADALVTNSPGQRVAVRTADCLPLLFAARRRRAVAAVHAGWRGTAAGIAEKTVRKLSDAFDADPAELLVAIGPGIGVCCYRVGPDVAARFRGLLPHLPEHVFVHVDLAEANRRQLRRAGVPDAQIDIAGMCTRCRAGEFFSHRHNPGETGRMRNVIGIVGGPDNAVRVETKRARA